MRLARTFGGVCLLSLLWPTITAPASAASAPKQSDWLSADDVKLLERLLKRPLFDPKGAEFVRVKSGPRTVWDSKVKVEREGWLVAASGGQAARVYFIDGESAPLPEKPADWKKVDFLALCRKRYGDDRKASSAKEPQGEKVVMNWRQSEDGQPGTPDLAMAAWLYRFGQAELAAKALERAYEAPTERRRGYSGFVSPETPEEKKESSEVLMVRAMERELARSAFELLLSAYAVRSDEEALAQGERLLRLYPEQVKREHPQAEAVVADLKRRKQKGTFGKKPGQQWPDGFPNWDVPKRTAWLIDALDEVEDREHNQWGGGYVGTDRRVQALTAMGEATVPALIDAVEKDQRLTRSIRAWRDDTRRYNVVPVREAALTAVSSVLRMHVFDSASQRESSTADNEKRLADSAARLRAYWTVYGRLPFDERMMKTLTDPKADFLMKREAAGNLASFRPPQPSSRPLFGGLFGRPAKPAANPTLTKFTKPTAAEAMLAALDADLAHLEKAAERGHWMNIEDAYLQPLLQLGDKRIAPELARREKATLELRLRRKYAFAAHKLGESAPLKALAADVETGSVNLPSDDPDDSFSLGSQPASVELSGIVESLVASELPEADRALNSLAAPGHRYHAMVARLVIESCSEDRSGPWQSHPFCLRFLRQALDDTEPTDSTWRIQGDMVRRTYKYGTSSDSLPAFLKDPAKRLAKADERGCDRAASALSRCVFGLPMYHPLLKDRDARLAEIKAVMDRYQARFRRMTPAEMQRLKLSTWEAKFIPALTPLDRPATREDVEQGRAVFQLDGKGKVVRMELPAAAILKEDAEEEEGARRTRNVLVVQAETGPGGAVTYGIIGERAIRAVDAEQLSGITAVAANRSLEEPVEEEP